MFALPNPKKTITIDFSMSQIMNALPKINVLSDGKYSVTKINTTFNQITLESLEFLSLGVYIDFNLVSKTDTSTELTIEIRRKLGSFDTDIEIQRANDHFQVLVDYLSEIIVLSESEFNKKYLDKLNAIAKNKELNDLPWYAKPYIANLYIILGIVTLPLLIGFIILPVGIYAKNKKNAYFN